MLLAAVLICILSRSVASLELDEVKAEGLCDELIAVAQVAVHEKNLEKALESLASCIAIEPTHADAHWNTGVVLSMQGKQTETLDMLEKAVQLRPADASYCGRTSALLMGAGEHDRALSILSLYIRAAGFSDWFDLHKHLHHRVLGENREKGVAFAKEHGEEAASLVRLFVNIKLAQQVYNEAYRGYELLLALQPSDGALHSEFGQFAAGVGQLTESFVHGMHSLARQLYERDDENDAEEEEEEKEARERSKSDSIASYMRHISLLSASFGFEATMINLLRSVFLRAGADDFHTLLRLNCHVKVSHFYTAGESSFISRVDAEGMFLGCLTQQKTVSKLISEGAQVSVANVYNHSVLHVFAALGDPTLLARLIDRDGEGGLDIQNHFGQTPLHCAAIRGQSLAVQTLLDGRADEDVVDEWGRTAWESACAAGEWAAQAVAEPFGLEGAHECPSLTQRTLESVAQSTETETESEKSTVSGWVDGVDDESIAADLRRNECDIDVVSADSFTAKDFVRDYLSVSRPVLVRKGAQSSSWQRKLTRDALLLMHADTPVSRVSIPYAQFFPSSPHRSAQRSSLRSFIDYMRSSEPSSASVPHYVFESLPANASLATDVFADFLPDFLDPLDTNITRSNIQFFLGPPRSGSPIHWHSSAWNALVYGRKRWFLFAPLDAFYSQQPVSVWAKGDRARLPRRRASYECVQQSGDVMFVPDLWGHGVLNLRDSVGFASEFQWANTILELDQ